MAKPFHESIVEILEHSSNVLGKNGSPLVLGVLASLIEKTVIPKNHDVIAKALVQAAINARDCQSYITKALTHLDSEKTRSIGDKERKAVIESYEGMGSH